MKSIYFPNRVLTLSALSLFGTLVILASFLPALARTREEASLSPGSATDQTDQVATQQGTLPEIHPYRVKKTFWLTVTAYSSTVDQTDGDPFTTAAGTTVRDGIVAYNFLPIGTRVRFPEAFGEKVFIVQDRLHEQKGYYLADLWMRTREEAKTWGARILKIEILSRS